MLGFGQRRLDFFQGEFELIRIELLRPASETVTLQGVDDRLQPFDLGPENLEYIELAGLFENERTQRFNVVGKVRFHKHEGSESVHESPVNRQSAGQSGVVHHALGANPDPRAMHRVALPSDASRRPEYPAT